MKGVIKSKAQSAPAQNRECAVKRVMVMRMSPYRGACVESMRRTAIWFQRADWRSYYFAAYDRDTHANDRWAAKDCLMWLARHFSRRHR
ncbi:hypothetical protein AT395_20885 [Pandoraea apista]|nr:hypothetical protein AT395_20885 [Pandoraea apista]